MESKKLNLSPILYKEPASDSTGTYHMEDRITDFPMYWIEIVEVAKPTLETGEKYLLLSRLRIQTVPSARFFPMKFQKNTKQKDCQPTAYILN
jgi:hypothetical protein